MSHCEELDNIMANNGPQNNKQKSKLSTTNPRLCCVRLASLDFCVVCCGSLLFLVIFLSVAVGFLLSSNYSL